MKRTFKKMNLSKSCHMALFDPGRAIVKRTLAELAFCGSYLFPNWLRAAHAVLLIDSQSPGGLQVMTEAIHTLELRVVLCQLLRSIVANTQETFVGALDKVELLELFDGAKHLFLATESKRMTPVCVQTKAETLPFRRQGL